MALLYCWPEIGSGRRPGAGGAPPLHYIAHAGTDERAGEGRDPADLAVLGVRLVLADDREFVALAGGVGDFHHGAEGDFLRGRMGGVDHDRALDSRFQVADLPGAMGKLQILGRVVRPRRQLALALLRLGEALLQETQPAPRDIVGVLALRQIGQPICRRLPRVLVDAVSAHDGSPWTIGNTAVTGAPGPPNGRNRHPKGNGSAPAGFPGRRRRRMAWPMTQGLNWRPATSPDLLSTPSSTRPTARCSATAASTAPSIVPPDRDCSPNAAASAAAPRARPGPPPVPGCPRPS